MTSVVVNSSQQQQSMGGQPGVYRPLPNQYYPAPATMASQQSSNTNVVVANQPAPVASIQQVTLATEKPNPTTFIATIILMSLCSCLGMFHLLICFIPALIFSVVGFNYGYSKSEELQNQSKIFTHVAAGLNITAMVTFALTFVITAIILGVELSKHYYW